MPTVLITGANRGLGLEFARQYAAAGWHIAATCRDLDDAAELRALPGEVTIYRLDAVDDRSLDALLDRLSGIPLDLIIPNAGIGSGMPKSAAQVIAEDWQTVIGVNTFAPLRLVTGLRANLERGEHKKVAGISSLAASMTLYDVPGHYVYRASKAALNSLWRSLSIEWRPLGITCLLLRPGRVRTRMTQFIGDLSSEQSVSGMRRVIDNATIGDTGQFFGYDGAIVPW